MNESSSIPPCELSASGALPAQPVCARPPPRRGRRALELAAWLLAGFLALAFVTGLLASMAVHVSAGDLHRWQDWAHGVRNIGAAAQCLALALTGLFWRPLVAWGHRRGIVQGHEFDAVLRLRVKAMAWGALYLLLVPIGPVRLWHLLSAWF